MAKNQSCNQSDDTSHSHNSKLGVYKHSAVATNTELSAEIGQKMLDLGGSAVDAAIAVLLCEGLSGMQNMGIGGGLLMTIYKAKTTSTYCLNAREVAPKQATKNMFHGQSALSTTGSLSVGVPGELMGYWEAHKKFGKLPWKELFSPAIKLCREGVPVNKRLAKNIASIADEIEKSPSLFSVLSSGGRLPKLGEKIRLPSLASTLSVISKSEKGAEELYNGSLTQAFVNDIKELGGIITYDDMANYRAKWVDAVQLVLRGGETVFTTPPPSAGLVLCYILSLLDGLLSPDPQPNITNASMVAEAFKYGYALRTELGDPDFVDMSKVKEKVHDPEFVRQVRRQILRKGTSNDPHHYGVQFINTEDKGTINITVLAPNGDAVCATSSINTPFGSLLASKTTGIILNNHMDDFSSPNIVNTFGLPPSPANFIVPGKRPVSSMCPTIVVDKEGRVRLVVGAAGGTRITTAVVQVIVQNLFLKQNIKEAVDFPRIHHQMTPMYILYEFGYPKPVIEGLVNIGHATRQCRAHASVTAIARQNSTITAIYDHRRGGSTAGS